MGRVLIGGAGRPRFLGLAGVVLALCAWTAFAAAPARADEPQNKEAAAEKEEKNPLEHAMDSYHIELFESFGPPSIDLPYYDFHVAGRTVRVGLSKYMLLEVLAAVLVALFYVPLARRMASGQLPRGWSENAREVLLTFVRNEVARPTIGEEADRYVPFLWTLFLFVLFNNLLGLVPFCGSPTGSIYVTIGLALCVFFAIHGSGVQKMGFGPYISSLWPHVDVPFGLGYVLKPLIFYLDWQGVLIRNAVLAVRLFANMFAGHVVLATLLIFIYTAGHLYQDTPAVNWSLWSTVTVLSVLGQLALSLLELFVAFLQAYIFVFLSAIFMGMAMHPAH
jgi:F-type H+-transporting ATPase subunit a